MTITRAPINVQTTGKRFNREDLRTSSLGTFGIPSTLSSSLKYPMKHVVIALLCLATMASSAAAQSGSTTVLTSANIYLSGNNTMTSYSGFGQGTAPNLISLLSGTGRVLQFGSVTLSSGISFCSLATPCPPSSPDGPINFPDLTNTALFSSGVISGISAPSSGFLVGVFLGASLPGSAPASLTYTSSSMLQPNFTSLQLGQMFFIGDGQGTAGTQSFFVPDAATRLYLGTADGANNFTGAPGAYDDNTGSYSVRYGISSTTAPEPASIALVAAGLGALALAERRRRRS